MVCSNAIGSWLRITAGAVALLAACAPTLAAEEPPHSAELDAMIVKEAQRHGVPERLVRRIVMRESRYNPRARNHKYWGLMQISYPTARSMGFKGRRSQLLNPLVNLTYAVPYLANAFLAAGKREDAAVRLYASGYYDTARHLGLLGQLRTADSAPAIGFHDDVQQVAAADSQPSFGIFGALLNPFDPSPAPAAASYAAVPPQDAPAAPAPSVPAGGDAPKQVAGDKGSGGNVNMVAGKAGDAEPPKKWQHDGGITVLARGEQSAGHAAAAASETTSRRTASRHTRKSTQFAAVDAPASAQAYAPSADGTLTPSQSAISDAMTAQGVAVAAGDPPARQPAYTPAPAGMREASATTSAATDDKHAAKRKARKIAARHRAHIAKQDRAEPAEANGAAAADAEAIPAGSAEAVAAIRP